MKTKKKRSQKQEKSVAKTFNAYLTPASGAFWGQKGDVRNDKFLIECKTTEKDYYSLHAKTWEKIEKEAIRDHVRIPLLVVDIRDRDRLVVFKPNDLKDASTAIYDVTKDWGDKVPKSRKISIKELEKISEDYEAYVTGKLFMICDSKVNMLLYMRMKDFENIYGEELM